MFDCSYNHYQGPGGSMSYVVGLLNNSYKPITNTAWVRTRLCILQKGCTRLAAACDKAYQLLAHGRCFSPASSTTKACRHDIAEILLKVALSTNNQINQSINHNHYQVRSKSKDWKTKQIGKKYSGAINQKA